MPWLKENEEADTDEFKAAKKAIEDVATPIISKLYQNGDMPPPGAGEDEEAGGHADDEL